MNAVLQLVLQLKDIVIYQNLQAQGKTRILILDLAGTPFQRQIIFVDEEAVALNKVILEEIILRLRLFHPKL